MYDNNLNGKELCEFHNKVKINKSYRLSEVFNNNPLFKIVQITNNIYKIFPLFYCDKIISSNEEDRIIENKYIICNYNEYTILQFISNTVVNDFNLVYEIVNKHSDNLLYGIIYDSNNKNPIKEANVTINIFSINNLLKENINLNSDEYGGFIIPLKNHQNTDIVKFTIIVGDNTKIF